MTNSSDQDKAKGEPWYPSRFGADDEIGALNFLQPENILAATALVKRGETYSLAIPTGPETPAYPPRSFQMNIVSPGQYGGSTWGKNKAGGIDEFFTVWPGIGTHFDGLGHIAIGHKFYNGSPSEEVYDHTGVKKFGTETIPPIVTRGVLLDIAALRGVDIMEPGDVITPGDIEAAMERQGVEIRSGDVVMLRTGWIKTAETEPEKFIGSVPGLGKTGAQYLADAEVVIIGVDQYSTEVMPAEDADEFIPVHQLDLAINGVYHLQNVMLEDLARDGVNEFMFVLGLPKFVGATQMTANPVAIC
ncbi:Probable polyketide cyclase [hydrothermal vent metagenome]|uniref:Probable polyketide cyclase n=1 Tax=hydrothermal vent metagenome TaxID=652676 RepID=A0A3B0SJF9_9ZZZZ